MARLWIRQTPVAALTLFQPFAANTPQFLRRIDPNSLPGVFKLCSLQGAGGKGQGTEAGLVGCGAWQWQGSKLAKLKGLMLRKGGIPKASLHPEKGRPTNPS
jgi:hypothetical protein